jgi:hypothetical protein
LGNEEERCNPFAKLGMPENLKKTMLYISGVELIDEDEAEERNDVYIYKTLRYPPKTTPPTID